MPQIGIQHHVNQSLDQVCQYRIATDNRSSRTSFSVDRSLWKVQKDYAAGKMANTFWDDEISQDLS